MKATFVDELVVLLTHCGRQFHQGELGNITASLYAELLSYQREQEGEGTEVVSLREVSTQSTGQLPEFPSPMGKRFLVGEEVSVTLHRDPEALGENIVARCGGFLGPFYIQLIGLIGNGCAQIWIGFQPGGRIGNFLDLIQ